MRTWRLRALTYVCYHHTSTGCYCEHTGMQSFCPCQVCALPRLQLEHVYPHIARRDAAAGVNAAWLRSLRPAEAARASPCALLEWGVDRPSAPAPAQAQEAPGAPLAHTGQQPGPAASALSMNTVSGGDQARSQLLAFSGCMPDMSCVQC